MANTIMNFKDYRLFLLNHLEEGGKKGQGISVSKFTRDLGLKDASSINKVIRGQRHPGRQMVEKLCRYFEFSPKEESFFRTLVELARSEEGTSEYENSIAKLVRMAPDNQQNILKLEEFQYIANWHFLAIKEMLNLKGFKNSIDWIQSRLKFNIPKRSIADALEIMKSIRVLKSENGRLVASDKVLSTPTDIKSVALKKFHRGNLELIETALREFPLEERYFSSTTVSIKAKSIPKIKRLIEEFQDEIIESHESRSGDDVYQLNIQLIPLTKRSF